MSQENVDAFRRGTIGSIRMRGRESSVETDVPTAAVVEFRDGLLWRYKGYGQARLALEAAGLSE